MAVRTEATAYCDSTRPGCTILVIAEVRTAQDAQGDVAVLLDPRQTGADGFVRRMSPRSTGCPSGRRCFDASVELDVHLSPGAWPLKVEATDSQGRIGRGTAQVLTRDPRDTDADGLPDVWEQHYQLNPSSAEGLDGAGGDPDADGVTNLQEFRGRTNPAARYTRYFVEGSAGDRQPITTKFRISSPGGQPTRPAPVRLLAIGDDGRLAERFGTTPAAGSIELWPLGTWHPADRVNLVAIESMTPLLVERQISSGVVEVTSPGSATAYAYLPRVADTSHGVQGRATDWHFADGSTSDGMDLFLLFFNPTSAAVTATLTYVDDAARVLSTGARTLPPGVRTTVWVNRDDPEMAGRRFSVAIHASDGILVERAYRDRAPGKTVPHDSVTRGASQASTVWHFADVDPQAPFKTSIVAWNPTDVDADVVLTVRNRSGEPRTVRDTVAAGGRREWSTRDLPTSGERTTSVSLESQNGVALVVERVSAGQSGAGAWRRAALGATGSGVEWGFAASLSPSASFETEFVVTNVSDVAARVSFVATGGYFETASDFTVEVLAQGVARVPVRGEYSAQAPYRYMATGNVRVTSLPAGGPETARIVVERTVSWPLDGVARSGATSLIGNLLR